MPFLINGALLSVSAASRGQLVNMLTTLEAHGILGSNFVYLYFSTAKPPVCKMVRRLSFHPVEFF